MGDGLRERKDSASVRLGLEDRRRRTLEQVGREFGVTRERIRQIEAKALRKLRHPPVSQAPGRRKWLVSSRQTVRRSATAGSGGGLTRLGLSRSSCRDGRSSDG